ncbi:MAG: ABC transporter permease subunit [Nitrososphaerales archaeon]
MNLQNSWAVAAKDFKIFRKKPTVIYASIALPVIIGVVFPLILNYSLNKATHAMNAAGAETLMDAFSIWFLIGAAIIPTAIASYALVGEKVQKSLEPLLATPMTDGEILLGKIISGLLIPLVAIYSGALLFMVLMDNFTHSLLGFYYYPNSYIGVILLCAPLASLLSVELNVIVSSRLSDVRSAQQLGSLLILPFIGLYFASETGIFPFTDTNLLIIAGALLVINVFLFLAARATFQREEILTSWR